MPKAQVNCFVISRWALFETKTLILKWNIAFSLASDARRVKGLGETPQLPGHLAVLTPGRADCVIFKCFRLQPDGCVKRDHTHTHTHTDKHIGIGLHVPHTNNSCQPDALQNYSLKHLHTNMLTFLSCSIFLRRSKVFTLDTRHAVTPS